MVARILREGSPFSDGFKSGRVLAGVGHIEVYRSSKRVYLCVVCKGMIELTGKQAAIVRLALSL